MRVPTSDGRPFGNTPDKVKDGVIPPTIIASKSGKGSQGNREQVRCLFTDVWLIENSRWRVVSSPGNESPPELVNRGPSVLVYRSLSLKDVAVALIPSWYGVPEKPYALANFDESKRYAESL